MLLTIMRALWSIVVVCLVAASGVQPVRAAGFDREDHTQLGDRHPMLPAVLPAVAATRSTVARVAPRTTAPRLPAVVLAAAPLAPALTARAIAGFDGNRIDRGRPLVTIRSARGPPAR
jgi:hypothetical protein